MGYLAFLDKLTVAACRPATNPMHRQLVVLPKNTHFGFMLDQPIRLIVLGQGNSGVLLR